MKQNEQTVGAVREGERESDTMERKLFKFNEKYSFKKY